MTRGELFARTFADVVALTGQAPCFTYAVGGHHLTPGQVVRVPLGKRIVHALVWDVHNRRPSFPVRDVLVPLSSEPLVPPHLIGLARWMSDYHLAPPGRCLGPLLPGSPTTLLRALGWIGRKQNPSVPEDPAESVNVEPPPLLASDQRGIADLLGGARGYRTFLLHGVTGSGKTAVFLEAARAALDRGQDVVLLVPEIGLTPQTVARVRGQLPATVEVLHSQLSPNRRRRAWLDLRTGAAKVALGPRSALFAPLSRPGLIVVDEEHDSSYKQTSDSPRYHGRDAAVWLARALDIPIVLASATPSLESWHNTRTGRYTLVSLPHRAKGARLPEIRVADLRETRRRLGDRALSEELLTSLREATSAGASAILLHNRRGWAPQVTCNACGHVWTCPRCTGLHLVEHRGQGLRCHHCGHREASPASCSACGGQSLVRGGHAIQRVEDELRRELPGVAIRRLDRDTATTEGAALVLDGFRREGGILLGTQMVAKGHDLPAVTVAGVIDADQGSWAPDFRASERSFQLLVQVAGRAGRADRPGVVWLQTRRPEGSLVTAVCTQDVAAFAERELALRAQLRLPPFSRLWLLELSAPDPGLEAADLGRELARKLRIEMPSGTDVLGPEEAPLSVVRGRRRWHLLIKAEPSEGATVRKVLLALWPTRTLPQIRLRLDVDPVDLL